MTSHRFTGFGFGPIQSGLFANEAYRSGRFERIVIAEIDANLVQAVRDHGGVYALNVAHHDRIETLQIKNVELLNPQDPQDREGLIAALAESTEIATSLPSVTIFTAGGDSSVAALIAGGLAQRKAPATIIYTGENNNHAAEILQEAVQQRLTSSLPEKTQFLNTVIGKMSQVVTDPERIERMKLAPIAPGIDRAFLVEAFNRILVTRTRIEGFTPGIQSFLEKDDLLPFEEAKLYGHNAIHALLAYLGRLVGCEQMTELAEHPTLMAVAREAFITESGGALINKYQSLNDPLFTPDGYREYAEDLLTRMTNPWLEDSVERAGRDPIRKLGLTDRLFGTICLALDHNITPTNMALGAMAGLARLLSEAEQHDLPGELRVDWRDATSDQLAGVLEWLWADQNTEHRPTLLTLLKNAQQQLVDLLSN